MTYENNSDYTFFAITICYGILYTTDINNYIEDVESIIDGIEKSDFLEFFLDKVTKYTKKGKLSPHSISNVQKFISHYRFKEEVLNDPQIKRRVYKVCNSFIELLNYQKYSNQISAYYEEIAVRYKRKLDLILKTFSYWNDRLIFEKAIHAMRELDFIILCTHSDIISEDDFKIELIDMLANPYYLVCIEYLLNAYPKLFKDEQFRGRILYGLTANRELISESKGKVVEESDYYLMDEDIEILKDKSFIKTNKRFIRRIEKLKKDS